MSDQTLGSFRDRLFQKVAGVAWDLQSGQLGVKTSEKTTNAIVTLQVGDDGKFTVRQSPKAFGISVPAFAMRTPVDQLKPGDIVLMDDDNYGFYTGPGKHAEDSGNPTLRILTVTGHKSTDYIVPTEALFGGFGVLAIKNLCGDAGVANMLPFLLLLGKDKEGDDNVGQMVAMAAMMGGGAKLGDTSSMLPLLLLGESGNDPLMLMAMMGGFGGQQANGGNANANPFGSLLPFLLLKDRGCCGAKKAPAKK